MMTPDISRWIAELNADDESTRCAAAQELCYAGVDARPAAAALVLAAADENEEVREWATGALEELGPPEEEQAGRLAELLSRPEPDVAYWAATLLGRLGRGAAAEVPALTGALAGDGAAAVRERAAWALGRIGPPAATALPVLESSAAGPEERLARLAAEAIAAIRG